MHNTITVQLSREEGEVAGPRPGTVPQHHGNDSSALYNRKYNLTLRLLYKVYLLPIQSYTKNKACI